MASTPLIRSPFPRMIVGMRFLLCDFVKGSVFRMSLSLQPPGDRGTSSLPLGLEFPSPLSLDLSRPIRFLSCGLFQTEEAWRHPTRVIDSMELLLGHRGDIHLEQEGQPHVVRPGTALLLRPGVMHRGTRDSAGETSFYWMHFVLDPATGMSAETNPVPDPCHIQLPIVCHMPEPERSAILFRQLLHTAYEEPPNPLACHYLASLLLLECASQYRLLQRNTSRQAQQGGRNEPQRQVFEGILEHVRVHLAEPLTADAVARRFGFNADYMTRLFRRRLGVGFVRHVNNLRLTRAKTLLCQTPFSIKEISWQCGFSDEKYFMRLFREFEGITPTAYRNAYHHTHVNTR
jgi:AraC-like DNA-binding protein